MPQVAQYPASLMQREVGGRIGCNQGLAADDEPPLPVRAHAAGASPARASGRLLADAESSLVAIDETLRGGAALFFKVIHGRGANRSA